MSYFTEKILPLVGVDNVDALKGRETSIAGLESWQELSNAVKLYEGILGKIKRSERGKVRIGVLYDPDVDGLFGGYILENFLTRQRFNVKRFMNLNKIHGYSKSFALWVKQSKLDYLFVPDAGSSNVAEFTELVHNTNLKYVWVLDHHPYDHQAQGDFRCVYRVNELDHPDLPRWSGCGVAYQFLRLVNSHLIKSIKLDYEGLVGVTVLSDSCSLRDLDNRYYVSQAYKDIDKYEIFRAFHYYGSGNSFYNFQLVPFFNGLIRAGKVNDAMELVNNLDDKQLAMDVTKMMWKVREIRDDCIAKLMADREESKLILHPQLTLLLRTDYVEYSSYNGLVANNLLGEYGVSAVVLCYDKHKKLWQGSFRGLGMTNSVLAKNGIWVQGHALACGVKATTKQLRDLIVKEDIGVTAVNKLSYTFEIDRINSLTRSTWFAIAHYNEYAGADLPKIAVRVGQGITSDTRKVANASGTRILYTIGDYDVVDFKHLGEGDLIVSPVIGISGFQLLRE